MMISITQMLKINMVSELTGLSRSTIYEMMNPKSTYHDPTFPKKVNLTTNRVAWVASEINDWIQSRIAIRDQDETVTMKSGVSHHRAYMR